MVGWTCPACLFSQCCMCIITAAWACHASRASICCCGGIWSASQCSSSVLERVLKLQPSSTRVMISTAISRMLWEVLPVADWQLQHVLPVHAHSCTHGAHLSNEIAMLANSVTGIKAASSYIRLDLRFADEPVSSIPSTLLPAAGMRTAGRRLPVHTRHRCRHILKS